MTKERYHRVYQRGYEAGMADATAALRRFLDGGGKIVRSSGWSSDALTVRLMDRDKGIIGEISSLAALQPFHERAERSLSKRPV